MPSITKSLRSAGSGLVSVTKALLSIPVRIGQFAGRQAAGTWRNFRGFLGWLSIDRALPPAIASTINWTLETVPRALGIDSSSYQQTVAASLIIMVAAGSALLTAGLTLAVVVLTLPFLIIGAWRFIPAFNTAWRDSVQSRADDLPRWDR